MTTKQQSDIRGFSVKNTPVVKRQTLAGRLFKHSGKIIASFLLATMFFGCAVVEQATRTSLSDAISSTVESSIERRISGRLAAYTDVMMYQLVWSQAFYLGGFGFDPGEFQEGQGTAWRVEAVEGEDISSFIAERALLSQLDDGSTWWYLRFEADDTDPVEYEIHVTREFMPLAMYLRDPETGQVRHHEFEQYETDEDYADDLEDDLEEDLDEFGYQSSHFYLDSLDPWVQREETITVGAGSFTTRMLVFSPYQLEDDQFESVPFEYRWWVTPEVPGSLVRFEYRNLEDGSHLRGEMIRLRDDYRFRLASF